jgi:hypothetical protein
MKPTPELAAANRIVANMPLSDYLAAPGLSKHGLDLFAECPEKFFLKRLGLVEERPTEAMQFGSCLHAALLEGRRMYHVRPDTYGDGKKWNGNANECKEWLRAHSDRPVLSGDDDARIEAICQKVKSDRLAAPLLEGGRAELSVFATEPQTGVLLKGRPDYVSADGRIVVDLKTIANASTQKCARAIADRRYHIQAALYFTLLEQFGYKPERFYFIFVETSSGMPLLNVRRLGDATINLGRRTLEHELFHFAACEAAGMWPGYSGEDQAVPTIEAPDSAFYGEDEALEMNA